MCRMDYVIVQGMGTCPHCKALLQGPTCQICGNRPTDVVNKPAVEAELGFNDIDLKKLAGVLLTVGVVIVAAVGSWLLLQDSPAAVEATALPPPSPTTIRIDEDAPSITQPDAPIAPLPDPTVSIIDTDTDTGIERSVGGTPAQWAAPTVNLLTAEPLAGADYQTGITEVARILAAGATGFEFGPPLLVATANGIDLEAAEPTQPFAARSVTVNGAFMADLWLIAAPPGDVGPARSYLGNAFMEWPVDVPLDQFSPSPGWQIYKVSDDGEIAVWVEQQADRVVVLWTPTTADPALLAAFVQRLGSN